MADNADIERLAEKYFIHELGLDPDVVDHASQNILGYFRTLHSIQARLEQEEGSHDRQRDTQDT